MRDIHIVTVGFDPKPSLETLCCKFPKDKIYLLNDRTDDKAKNSENLIIQALEKVEQIEYEVVPIECYNFQQIYDKVIEISDNETKRYRKCRFHINFSRGTGIVVGAVCSAAYEINADLYYSKIGAVDDDTPVNERIIHIDIESDYPLKLLKGTRKEVFLKFKSHMDGISNEELIQLCEFKNPSGLTYHTKKLQEDNLIERRTDGQKDYWILTGKGKKTIKRLT